MFKKYLSFILALFVLTGCLGGLKSIDVDLSEADRVKWETDIVKWSDKIKNYEPTDKLTTPQAPVAYYVKLAYAYEQLGQLNKSFNIYQDGREFYTRSQAFENNIAKLYEKAGEYEKALEQYLYLSEEFQETKYLRNMVKIFIEIKDRKNAEKYFNLWQLSTQSTDLQIQQQIKALREEEKADTDKNL